MRVGELMTSRVLTISAGESAEHALALMRARRIHHLVVLQGQEVAGVVSSRDLEAAGTFRQVQVVEDVMTSPALTAAPHMTLRQAANLLRGRTIGCLPVTEDGELVGILTTTDLLAALGRGVARPVSEGKRWILKDRGPRRKSDGRR
jgi:acetoin utilization protein AcuB